MPSSLFGVEICAPKNLGFLLLFSFRVRVKSGSGWPRRLLGRLVLVRHECDIYCGLNQDQEPVLPDDLGLDHAHQDGYLFDGSPEDLWMMYVFKIFRCLDPRHNTPESYKNCDFSHHDDNYRRRDPDFGYLPIRCKYGNGERCPLHGECKYAHNAYEVGLHPHKYKTELCILEPRCRRKICFFAHSSAEVRQGVVGEGAAKLMDGQQEQPVGGLQGPLQD